MAEREMSKRDKLDGVRGFGSIATSALPRDRARRWAFLLLVSLLSLVVLLGACKTRGDSEASGDPANATVNKDARQRLDAIREMMQRGENTTVRCAGAKTYADFLATDKSPKSVALVVETKKLCEHEAPLAFTRSTLRRMEPRGSSNDCAAVGQAIEDIAVDHKASPDVREVVEKHKKLCH